MNPNEMNAVVLYNVRLIWVQVINCIYFEMSQFNFRDWALFFLLSYLGKMVDYVSKTISLP